MFHKKPVLVTNSTSLTNLVTECKSGLVYNYEKNEDLANKIIQLADEKVRKKYGKNGFDAVINKYNWQIDSVVMLNSISKILTMKK